MLDAQGNVLAWDENPAHLIPFKQVTLKTSQEFLVYSGQLYSGQFVATGLLNVHLGYRLENGTIISFAIINVTIVDSEED